MLTFLFIFVDVMLMCALPFVSLLSAVLYVVNCNSCIRSHVCMYDWTTVNAGLSRGEMQMLGTASCSAAIWQLLLRVTLCYTTSEHECCQRADQ